ncbi:MAG: hypothetical protein IIA45_01885 [Bacteroidetes bacterium]|nr:hypothetical protein [Bacteroidota bacterium]
MISWVEIPTVEFERAVKFYSDILQIDIQVYDLLGEKYGHIPNLIGIGCVLIYREGYLPKNGPIIFFKVDDITSTLDIVDEAGGEVLQKKTIIKLQQEDGSMIIPKTLIDNKEGYYARFKDSEGNEMALHSNG